MAEKMSSYRLGEQHDELLADLVKQTRVSATEAIRIALEERHRKIFGRRAAADRVPVKARRPPAPK